MDHDISTKPKGLPENAYRQLKPGEEYTPVVPADKPLPEATSYSVLWGMFYIVCRISSRGSVFR